MSAKKILMLAVSGVMTLIAFIAIHVNHLWGATFVIWGLHVSVWVGAIVMAVIIGGIALLFGLQEDETPNWFVVSVIIAILVCLVGGLVFTQPVKSQVAASTADGQPYFRSYVPYYYIFGSHTSSSGTTSSTHISAPSGNNKGLGYAIIIILIIMMVIGSFIIPHFWVAAILAILFVSWGFTIKELSDSGSTW